MPLLTKLFDARQYGARCDGKTDDGAAVTAAFRDMFTPNGHPDGTLLIPSNCFIATTCDLNCGYPDPVDNVATAGPERFSLRVEGLAPAAGIGTALKLRNGFNIDAHVRIVGGGRLGDVGVYVDGQQSPHVVVEGLRFAGTLLVVDGATAIQEIRNWSINAVECGQAFAISNTGGFGYIGDIWDALCVNGSTLTNCSDLAIGHYESYHPPSQVNGLTLTNCNSLNIGIMSVGGNCSGAILSINGGDVGRIQQIRASFSASGQVGTCGVELTSVHSILIGQIETLRCPKGVWVRGGCSNAGIINIGQHQSLTGDDNALYVDAASSTDAAPRVLIGAASYRMNNKEAVFVSSAVTGGFLQIGGTIDLENISNTVNYTINIQSTTFLVYALGLIKAPRAVIQKAFFAAGSTAQINITGGVISNWP